MRKLLSANFLRLWKSRAFWLLEGGCFAIGTFVYALVAYNTRNLGQGWLADNAQGNFYLPVLFLPFFCAIFTCFFIGVEYSDGVLRNKLTVGHSRVEIYLSFLVTTVAAMFLFVLAYLLAVLLVGPPLSGKAVLTQVQAQPWRLLGCALFLTEYAALFTMLAMLDSYKARNIVISLLAAGVLLLGGIVAYRKLTATEFIQQVIMQPDGSFLLEDGMPNPNYLTGSIRRVFQWITAFLPSGSIMLNLDKRLGFDWRNPLCAVTVTVLLTVCGIQIFQRKDIK